MNHLERDVWERVEKAMKSVRPPPLVLGEKSARWVIPSDGLPLFNSRVVTMKITRLYASGWSNESRYVSYPLHRPFSPSTTADGLLARIKEVADAAWQEQKQG